MGGWCWVPFAGWIQFEEVASVPTTTPTAEDPIPIYIPSSVPTTIVTQLDGDSVLEAETETPSLRTQPAVPRFPSWLASSPPTRSPSFKDASP
ncbi:hypothetical protein TIFTF001_017283 [Ficus carica]|uniref:Uncharacterized protein n=1 Tax=Ficus carica TaxID=3494 RepID=A0AA88DAK8_FICCA|nr:hypothetical protein TIFTF001_017283 [Ficus carica]